MISCGKETFLIREEDLASSIDYYYYEGEGVQEGHLNAFSMLPCGNCMLSMCQRDCKDGAASARSIKALL